MTSGSDYKSALAVFLVFAAFAPINCTEAQQVTGAVDTQHIYGFDEGADVGEAGHKEVENSILDRLGKPWSYNYLENQTVYRYDTANKLELSFGTFLAGYNSAEPDAPQFSGFNFDGLIADARWQLIERERSGLPLDFAVALSPQWRRFDDQSGAREDKYLLHVEAIADWSVVPEKLFVNVNLIYEPGAIRTEERWERDAAVEAAIATSYAITKSVFIGGEVRHFSGSDEGVLDCHALFLGAHILKQISDTFSVKFAWSSQVPDVFESGRLDPVNFERHRALLQFVRSF